MSNCFKGRDDGYVAPAIVFEDVPHGVYALVTKAVIDPNTKEPVIISETIKTDEIKFQKVIDVEAKGADLKSLVAKVESTGDVSLINQRKAVYGDGYQIPRKLEDALQKGVDTGAYIDKFTPEQIALMKKLGDMSVDERKAFLETLKPIEDKKEPIVDKTAPIEPKKDGD